MSITKVGGEEDPSIEPCTPAFAGIAYQKLQCYRCYSCSGHKHRDCGVRDEGNTGLAARMTKTPVCWGPRFS